MRRKREGDDEESNCCRPRKREKLRLESMNDGKSMLAATTAQNHHWLSPFNDHPDNLILQSLPFVDVAVSLSHISNLFSSLLHDWQSTEAKTIAQQLSDAELLILKDLKEFDGQSVLLLLRNLRASRIPMGRSALNNPTSPIITTSQSCYLDLMNLVYAMGLQTRLSLDFWTAVVDGVLHPGALHAIIASVTVAFRSHSKQNHKNRNLFLTDVCQESSMFKQLYHYEPNYPLFRHAIMELANRHVPDSYCGSGQEDDTSG